MINAGRHMLRLTSVIAFAVALNDASVDDWAWAAFAALLGTLAHVAAERLPSLSP